MSQINIMSIMYALIPLIFAITMHEAAHAWTAKKLGDNTAFLLGRVSFNPLVHIHLIGTIIIPIVAFISTGFIFGWAKPVPVQFGRLNRPREDSVIVAAAGPLANVLMALGWAVIYFLAKGQVQPGAGDMSVFTHILLIAKFGVILNVAFMIINLIPVLPLDGGRITEGLLPRNLSFHYAKLEPYGMWIVLFLLLSGIYTTLLGPFIYALSGFLLGG